MRVAGDEGWNKRRAADRKKKQKMNRRVRDASMEGRSIFPAGGQGSAFRTRLFGSGARVIGSKEADYLDSRPNCWSSSSWIYLQIAIRSLLTPVVIQLESIRCGIGGMRVCEMTIGVLNWMVRPDFRPLSLPTNVSMP